jgi:hypothetical protein
MSSFDNKKELLFVITLGMITLGSGTATFTGTPQFLDNDGNSEGNQISLQGFRAVLNIDKGGGQMFGHLNAQIFGVSQSDMNLITTLQFQALTTTPNVIAVYAIDGDQQTLVFEGNIVNAWGDYQAMPDVSLHIQAQAAYLNMLIPVPPSSYKGAGDVATIMGQLAQQMGYTFENDNNVSLQLSNPYLSGTAIDQAKAVADAAGIWWGIDGQVLWITMPYTARPGQIPLISPQSGLKGYPTFDGQGFIIIETLFNPAIKFLGQLQLQSSIPRAAGQWTVVGIAHRLESEKPDGAWFSTIRLSADGRVPIQQ